MTEPNFQSKLVHPEIFVKITKFENTNCFETALKELVSPVQKRIKRLENLNHRRRRNAQVDVSAEMNASGGADGEIKDSQ